MTNPSKKAKTGLQRIVVLGLTLTIGLTFGILGVISFQKFGSQSEFPTQGNVESDRRQISSETSINGSTASPQDPVQISEIFSQPSIFDQQTAIFDSLSSASAQELKDLWMQSQEVERQSHRKKLQHAILRKLATINPHDALHLIDDVSIFETDLMVRSLFIEWSISQLDKAIETAKSLSRDQRQVALEAILNTRDDLTDARRHDIAIQLEHKEVFLKLASDSKASQNIADPQESWETLLNDEVEDVLQTESLVKVAEMWFEEIGFEVLSKIYSTNTDNYQLKQQLINRLRL